MKKILTVILICLIIALPVYADSTAQYLRETVTSPGTGQTGGEWTVFSLARYGFEDKEYFNTYYENLCSFLNENNGVLHKRKYTEYARVVIALSAINKNPENVAGYNMLKPLEDFDTVIKQGTNGAVYALIALDSKNYKVQTREKYINYILSRQNEDGGFCLTEKGQSEIDITAMAITSLAPYNEDEKVRNAIKRAAAYLENNEWTDCESLAQIIVAYTSIGKDPEKAYTRLMEYKTDRGFKHLKEDTETNLMSTEQGFYACVAYERFKKGESALFDMNPKGVLTEKQITLLKESNVSRNTLIEINKRLWQKFLEVIK